MALFDLSKLIAYYAYETGGPIPDLHTNGFDLASVGAGPTIEAGGKLGNRSRGDLNLANYARYNADDALWAPDDDGMTFVTWGRVPTGGLGNNHWCLNQWTNTDRGWNFFGRNSTDKWAVAASNDGTSNVVAEWSSVYVVETWYFVVGFLDPANDRIGIQVDRGTTVWTTLTAPFHDSSAPIIQHRFNGTSASPSGGIFDETSAWKTILDDDQLDFLYNSAGTPPGYAGIVAESEDAESVPINFPVREPLVVVELEQDQCRLIYGEAPCTAELDVTGTRKCYNTRATCQDPTNYDAKPDVVDVEAVDQDISAAGAVEESFDVSTEEAIPSDVAFSRDGTKLYVVGQDSDEVHQYPLSTPWDIGTAGAVEASFDVSTEDTTPQGIFFKPDGLKLYMVGVSSDTVHQYPLSAAWDVSSAGGVEASFSVAGEDTSPQGVFLKADGTKLYVVGGVSDEVHQYPLATPWDVSSAGSVEASFDVSTEDTDPQGLFIDSQGERLYVIGTSSDQVRQYPLATPWDVSTAGSVEASFSVAGEDTFPSGLFFSADRTKLYVVGVSGFVRQYPIAGVVQGTVSDARGTQPVSAAGAAEASFSVAGEEILPSGLFFKPDGLKLYVVGADSDEVQQYPLSTPWDVATAGAVEASFDVSSEAIDPQGVFIGSSGTKLYVIDRDSDEVHQYTLSTAWDVSSAGAVDTSFDVSTEETDPQGVFLKPDGTKLFIVGLNSDQVRRYGLATPWDLSTAGAVEQSFSVSGEDTLPQDLYFAPDGRKLYIVGRANTSVYQYPLATAWDLSTAGSVESVLDVGGDEANPQGLHLQDDGSRLYIVGIGSDTVYQYPIPRLVGTIDGAVHATSSPTGFSQALSFDGVDDSAEVLDPLDAYGFAGTDPFTVEFLLTPASIAQAFARLFDKQFTDGSGDQGWRILLRESDTSLVFERILDGSADSARAPVTLGKSRLWSAVYDGTELVLYEEGTEVARETSSNSIVTAGQTLTLGNTGLGGTSEPYHGLLDDVRIWDVARTEAQIRQRMILPLSGQESNLVSYFPLDHSPLPVATRTLRFTKPQTSAPKGILLLPLLVDVDTAPTRLNPGGASRDRSVLGERASVDAVFKDAPGSGRVVDKYRAERITGDAQTDEGGYEPLDRGEFWAKWRARNPFYQNRRLRVLEGYVGEELEDMQRREYFIDSMRGPDSDGRVAIRAKDVLKLADDERAQAPRATPGELSASLSDSETTSFQATGALVADYPDEPGLLRIGSELIEYSTRTQATPDNVQFNTLVRGARGTEAASHDAEDRVQRCLDFVSVLPWELAETLLVDFGNVPAEFIPSADWAEEGNLWLAQFTLSAEITEPTSVTDLLSEITQQAQFFIWWDEHSQTIKLKALRAPTEDPVGLNDFSHLIEDASSLTEDPRERLSQVWVFFDQRDPTADLEDEGNYSKVRILADLEAEDAEQYGESRIRKIFSRWLETEAQVIQVTKRTLDRFRNNLRTLRIRVDAKDRATVRVGEVADVETRIVVDDRGLPVSTRWQVVQAREEPAGEAVTLELLEFEFTGRFAFYMEDAAPDYVDASVLERKSGAWYADADGFMPDGTAGYQYQ